MFEIQSKNSVLNKQQISSGEIFIGRDKNCDLVIADSNYLSGKHIKILIKDDKIYIEDQDSTNGSYVDGQKLTPFKPFLLTSNHTVILGSEDVTFQVKQKNLDDSKTEVLKTKNQYTIGRAKDNDIVINATVISSHHLKIEKKNNEWYFYDLDSLNGTYHNSLSNKVKSGLLKPNETLYLGNYKIPTNSLIKYTMPHSKQKPQTMDIVKDTVVIGRDSNADISISHPSVSFHHAKLFKTQSGFELEDLKSTNGTYLNGKEVKGKVSVKNGDEIQLGIHSFILNLDDINNATIIKKDFINGFSIEANNINIELPNGTKLLDDISFTVNPGELVGLMGLSGAGKTTLLKALNGYTKPTSGTSLVNGNDLYKNFNLLKNAIGYVPQDDIVHPELTVKEALKYYAKLRIASDIKDKELDERIDNTLKKLGLDGTQKTVIGSPDTEKGISGGQRKRVNLAMELLADPQIIFLDEPTSGLSAVDTKMVMEQLRELANEGKTIIITIHQPSFDNYKIMDNQIILSFGKLAYYGPTYPNSITFFNSYNNADELLKNPDNALIGLNKAEDEKGELKLDPQTERNQKGIYWKETYKNSKEYNEFVSSRSVQEEKKLDDKQTNISSIRQFTTLTSRYLKIKFKDIANTSILLVQAPLIAIMIAMLFSEQAYKDMPITLLFVLAISAIWFGTINASREIVSEKAIFERERMIGIKLFPYIMSKFMILSILCAIQSIALVGIVEVLPPFSLGVGDKLLEIIFLTFLTSLGGLSIGLLVSTIAKSQAQALALVPIVLLPMIIFGGGMMSVKQMNENNNPTAYIISQVTPTKWALEEMTKIYENEDNSFSYCKNSEKFWKQVDQNKYKEHLGGSCEEVYNQNSAKYSQCKNLLNKCLEGRNFIDNNYGQQKQPTNIIYSVLSAFIVLPLLIMIIILKRRDNV